VTGLADVLAVFTPGQLVAVFATLGFAALVKGITGLGFSTTCLPFLVLAVGLEQALALVLLPSLTSNVIVMRSAGHFRETLVRFWPMFAATVPGVVLGLWVFAGSDTGFLVVGLGMVLVAYCLHGLSGARLVLSQAAVRRLQPASGFCTGLINGMTGSQIMPVLPFLLSMNLTPDRLVQAMNISFTLSSLIMAVGLSRLGHLSVESGIVSMAGVLVVFAGTRVGGRIRRSLSPEFFRKIVLVLLLLLGAILIVQQMS
jgi:uncharacterized membrane protein YfcA